MLSEELKRFFLSEEKHFGADELSIVLAAKMMRRKRKNKARETNLWVLERYSESNGIEEAGEVCPVRIIKDELSEFLDDLMGFYDSLEDGSRFQILCCNNGHWVSIDMSFEEGHFSIYLLDTTNVLSRATDLMFLLKQKLPISALYYTCGPFQADRYNCAVMAYDHMCCLAQITDLHDLLRVIHIKAKHKKSIWDYILHHTDPSADTEERVVNVFLTFAEEVLNELCGFYLASDSDAYNKLREILEEFHYMPVEWLTSDFAPLLRNMQRLHDYYPHFIEANPDLKLGRGSFTKPLTLDARISRHPFLHEPSATRRSMALDVLRVRMKREAYEFLATLTKDECEEILAARKRSFTRPSLYFSPWFPKMDAIFRL